MYQNLRHLVVGSEVQDSVHYIMIPDARKDLIDVGMERAVARLVSSPQYFHDNHSVFDTL
jgi:hypothetical protein